MAIAVVAGGTVYCATSDDKTVLNVDFVLGGGSDVTGKGDQLAIKGIFSGLATSPDNTVYLFTQEDDKSANGMVMWRTRDSGAVERITVSGMDGVKAEQAAAAPDGSVYLAGGDDGLWKVRPDGKATEVLSTRDCKKANPRATSISEFCTEDVSGVAVSEDGTVYIGDSLTVTPPYGSYVHRLKGDSVERVAGRPSKANESATPSDPAVRNGFAPSAGTKATDVFVPDHRNSGNLSFAKGGLYWRTGPGIVRINSDGILTPFVASKAPDKIGDVDRPFASVGQALDAKIPRRVLDGAGGLAAVPDRDEVYYGDAGEKTYPALEGDFRWGGVTSDSQKNLLESAEAGSFVYRVADGTLAPVIAGVQAIAASKDSLYVAVTTDGEYRRGPEDWDTALVRVQLPE
ncbi:WD40 repeat domain-containing protein [Streptomyces alboniger]|uniref:WD40 repeat domain-containing protein n=1 Tax=Streptomyces alboniger TaxID=132473 RepID=A0A5J6HM56_STRAD|nr:WD40 repeat domain-containing protein [Streptomyces alboniger]QEV19543.1 WD40 repeat domain-containing protein [Streptomyces alboniger]